MVLFENSIVKLDYDPATDIIEVAYPDLHTYLLAEIKYTIDQMVDIIKSYDIKKLLLDSSKTRISVSEEESREISAYLARGLATTRIQKVARLQSPSQSVEKLAQNNIKNLEQSKVMPFQLTNFSDKTEAIVWLKEKA
jgi:small-conductance mechanosensitive channel